MIRLIAAIDRQNGLAKNGGMPWHIPDDERYFTEMTKSRGGRVLTGGRTFREAYIGRPLAGRQNYVLTRRTEHIDGVTLVHDLKEFISRDRQQDLWIAGGAEVFEQALEAGLADELYLTHIDADFGCDQFFADYSDFEMTRQGKPREQNGFRYIYTVYAKRST